MVVYSTEFDYYSSDMEELVLVRSSDSPLGPHTAFYILSDNQLPVLAHYARPAKDGA